MKKYALVLLFAVAQSALAVPLTLAEFKQQSNQHYSTLESKQAALNSALDQKQHPSVLIEKACSYSMGLKAFKNFAKQNQHLTYAQEEYAFIQQLDEKFDLSLNDLGTSYEKGCLK